jgi:signal transduction histidine kinase
MQLTTAGMPGAAAWLGRASSHGIIGMPQRVAGFGGKLTVSAGRDNKGTQIRAELPSQRAAGTA